MKKIIILVVFAALVFGGCQSASNKEVETEKYSPGGTYGGGQWLIGVIHAHSVFSDGIDEPEDMVSYAKNEAGLDFFILTDHNYAEDTSTMGPKEFAELKDRVGAKAAEVGLLADVGEEVGAYSTEENIKYPGYPTWYGEALAFNITNFIDGAERKMEEIIPEALADNPGSFFAIAHPFNYAEDCAWMASWNIPGITHLEVWNAYEDGDYYLGDWQQAGELDDCDNPKAFMMWDYLNIRGNHIYGTTGTDSHDLAWFDTAYSVNYIGDKPATMEAVYESFVNGRFYGSNGPRISGFRIGDAMMGDTIEPGDVEINISTEYNSKIDMITLYKNGYVFDEWEPGKTLFEVQVTDTAEEGDFYRITVKSGSKAFAYSNPIFVS